MKLDTAKDRFIFALLVLTLSVVLWILLILFLLLEN